MLSSWVKLKEKVLLEIVHTFDAIKKTSCFRFHLSITFQNFNREGKCLVGSPAK